MDIDLFAPYCLGTLEIQNRFVRSATWDGSADQSGAVTATSVAIYRKLSRGCIGLVVSGYAFVSRPGKAVFGQYGAHEDSMIPGLARLVEEIHKNGSKIALQINHAGITAETEPAMAVSVLPHIARKHRSMSEEEIESVIEEYVRAALRACEAGFDAVQLHGAHGYLLSQFLSPLMNTRTDRWGGSLKNRSRFHIEIIKRIRKLLGKDFPLFIKFGIRDESERGLTLEDGISVSKWMIKAGIDAIEISAGVASLRGAMPMTKPGEPEKAVFRERAAALKRVVNVPVIVVGGIRNLATAEDIVRRGDADMISMSRPFIREPELLNRWLKDRSPAKCISCNQCHRSIRDGKGLVCGQENP